MRKDPLHVLDQILPMLQTDAQTNQAIVDAGFHPIGPFHLAKPKRISELSQVVTSIYRKDQ